jgi:hypothetical protein
MTIAVKENEDEIESMKLLIIKKIQKLNLQSCFSLLIHLLQNSFTGLI